MIRSFQSDSHRYVMSRDRIKKCSKKAEEMFKKFQLETWKNLQKLLHSWELGLKNDLSAALQEVFL
jgi:hypothetical protein